ncbi:protein C19orf12 homolog isoform X1 [Nematolebias whitei]|uniref:protein C19orf12 homolog isoform X1 n=1 Tax=Nematolebias whitei TaxID=451745 RepID=UPI001897E276|nr:protein C19orf12 homolog isoform X1 [Nematolebias whitei]
MGQRVDDVVQLCCQILSHDPIKDVVRNTYKGLKLAGGGVIVGSLLGGPAGMFVGGAVGSLMGGWLTRGQFRPLPQILMEMSKAEKKKLAIEVIVILGSLIWRDAAQLIALVMGNATLQQQVTATVHSYVKKNLRA